MLTHRDINVKIKVIKNKKNGETEDLITLLKLKFYRQSLKLSMIKRLKHAVGNIHVLATKK